MNFFAELKRRNVFKVGIAYAVGTWVLIQIADILLDNFGAPPWVMKSLVVVLAIGFFITLFFAWAYEMTPEGVKRESEVDRSQSMTSQTGRKLNSTILILMALAIGYLLFDKFSGPAQPGSDHFSQQTAGKNTEEGEKSALTPVQAIAQAKNEAKPAISNQSIAVLPFANRSNEQEDLFFTDGIHDDLLTQLAKIKDLKVISRTSVMEYRDTTRKIGDIAAELGVSKILEGGIQRAGKRIRINAQLIDVATDEHLWAETFDREMTVDNIFDIQSEITRHIVTAVRGELTAEETATLAQQPTSNLDAYEAYLKAKVFLNEPLYSPEKYINAEEWLIKAVASDPGFALAWALLVVTHGQAIWLGYDDSPERYQAALDALNNAEKFGAGLPETIAARAEYVYRINTDFHAAEPLFAQASQAKPGDPDLLVRLATTERRTGHFEQAITHYQMAIDLDPANLQARSVLLETLVMMGAFERAEPLADLWIEKYPDAQIFKTWKAQMLPVAHGKVKDAKALLAELEPNLGVAYFTTATSIFFYDRDYQGLIDVLSRPPLSHVGDIELLKVMRLDMLGRAYHYMGDSANANKFTGATIEACLASRINRLDGRSFIFSILAAAYANAGQLDKALTAANRALDFKPESADSLMGTEFSITRARVLGMAGQRDESLAEIERLLNTPGGLNRWDLTLNPDWDFFRDDERFNELARPLNLEETGK